MHLLLPILLLLPASVLSLPSQLQQKPFALPPQPKKFHLRHAHAAPQSVRHAPILLHSSPSPPEISASGHTIRTTRKTVRRPRPRLGTSATARRREWEWDNVEVDVPDVGDRETLLELARMTSDAYTTPDSSDWVWIGGKWGNETVPFGWDPHADGLRGHIFATPDNSTVVISIKGTSAGLLGLGGPSAKNDKMNDNLLFSCCCARVDWTWTPVCGCYSGGWNCEESCLEEAIEEESVYYPIGTNLYNNVTAMYPNANIWLVGHSLGGALASLLGLTFGAPVVAYEAPGERLPAQRLHLPSPPPELSPVTHVYHTADPIAMGSCNGAGSPCAVAGFAMESRCHVGRSVIYDTISRLGWSSDLRTHRIGVVIDKLLSEDWDDGEGHVYVPKPETEEDCIDCFRWTFGDSTEA